MDEHLLDKQQKFSQTKTVLSIVFFTCTTLIIFYLLFSQIDIHLTIKAIKNIKVPFLVFAFIFSVIFNIVISSDIRRYILTYLGYPISYHEALFLKMGTLPFKVIPTFKESGIVQAIYLKKYHKMPLSQGILATLLSNFLSLSSVMILFLGGVFLSWLFLPNIHFYKRYIFIGIIFSGLFFGFILYLLIFREKYKAKLFHEKKNPIRSHYSWIEKYLLVVLKLENNQLLFLLLYTLIFQCSEIFIFFILSKAFLLKIPILTILTFIPLTILISHIPLTLMGLSIREGTIILFFMQFGLKETLMGLGILVSFVEHIFPVLIGLFFLFPLMNRLKLE